MSALCWQVRLKRREEGMSSRYREVYSDWKADPEGFWAKAAEVIEWSRPWDKVFDAKAGVYGRRFVGAGGNGWYKGG